MYASPAMMTQLRMRGQAPVAGIAPMGGPAPLPGDPGEWDGKGGAYGKMIHNARVKGFKENQSRNPQLPYFEEDRARLGGMLNGKSPFAGGEWDGLVRQLQGQMTGANSLAQMQYRGAQQDTVAGLGSIARGSGSAAAGRQALIQQGRVGQGMAAGLAEAGTQERMAASSALTQALGTRDQLNQGAYLDILGAQLGLSRAQLEALAGNRDSAERRSTASKQESAAKWGAVAGGIGGAAKLF